MKTNTKTSRRTTQQNNLRQARDRAGLERKQVAFLLSKKTTDELSHYENGDYPPNLQTALKLEIIYKMPVRLLFPNLFKQLEKNIMKLKTTKPCLVPNLGLIPAPTEQLKEEEPCFYADLLKSHIPNELEIRTIIKHILALNNTISDFKQNRNSFAKNKLSENDL